MLTDPEVGLNTAGTQYLAWYDMTNGEIGDLCNGQSSTYTGCDGQAYSIQLEFSNAQNKCIGFPAPTCGTPVLNPTLAPVQPPTPVQTPTLTPVIAPTAVTRSPVKSPIKPTKAPVLPPIASTLAPTTPVEAQTSQPTSQPSLLGDLGILNPEFEDGLTSWTTTGATSTITKGCYSGNCAMAGAQVSTRGDSTISQTFTVPKGLTQLSFYYFMSLNQI